MPHHASLSVRRPRQQPAFGIPYVLGSGSDFVYGIFNSYFFSVWGPRQHDYGIINVSDFV